MPLTPKGREIMHAMDKEYGEKKGKQVFYASKNKGTITGVEGKHKALKRRVGEEIHGKHRVGMEIHKK